MQELELKMQGGLCARGGGVIAGFYGIHSSCLPHNHERMNVNQYTHCTVLLRYDNIILCYTKGMSLGYSEVSLL